MADNLNKFMLLFWKNWLLQIRHPIQTLFEILTPVLFTSLLVLVRSLVEIREYPEGAFFPPFSIALNSNYSSYSLAWSPYNPALEKIMDETVANLNMSGHVSYNSSSVMQAALTSLQTIDVLAGVQFDDSYLGNVSIDQNLTVTIRFPGELRSSGVTGIGASTWLTNLLFQVYQTGGPRALSYLTGGPPSYYSEGFLALQQELSFAVLEYFKGDDDSFERPILQMQRYPYPSWTDDLLLTALQNFVGMIIMLSFLFTCINTVRIITTEKEKQLKEMMKIMGLPRWLHWTAWFVKEFIFLQITIILIVVLVKVPWIPGSDLSVFTQSNPFVIYVLLLLYICATITFCFLLSVFFSKATVASTIAAIVWFLTYVPYMSVQNNYESLSLTTKLIISIFSNSAMAYGFQLMVMFEGNGEGVQWSNVWETASPDDNLVLGHIFIMLIVDTVLYLILALYIESVFPGKYGVPQKWYFPLTRSFWCGKSHYVVDANFEPGEEESEFFEKEPNHLKAGVRIKHLNKIYSNDRVAVRDLTLNMYEGQITALLGHNGAGKTTTMSMLTGMFPPTSGTATIAGYDIRTDMEGARKGLGLCPQHNILFDELTVREHLYFYSKLKGMKSKDIEHEINKFVDMLELTPKKNSTASTLSGGMKRKLCVGIALSGKPQVIMLDEPTAGVDPSARRALWDVLQQEKKGRTILLTTHFMDEADLLGDRIAIMAGGMLQCCGSSFFLKKKYGAGYHLIIDKAQDCSANDVTKLLNKYLPDLKVENNVGSELSYILDEHQSHLFEAMLSDLERNKSTLKVRSYGISLTTLEEVFMKVGADHGQEEAYNKKNGVIIGKHTKMNDSNSDNSDDSYEREYVSMENRQRLQGFALWRNQFITMLVKRVLSTYRSWFQFLIQVAIPIVTLSSAIIIARGFSTNTDLPSLDITLNSYESPVTMVSGSTENEYYEEYKNLITNRNHVYEDYGYSDLSQKILEVTRNNLSIVRRRYIAAASFFSNNSITAWFNNVPYHGAPLTLDLVINAIFQRHLGSSYRINIVNHPLPFSLDTRLQQLMIGNSMGFQIAFNLGFAMAVVSSFYIMFYIRERVSKAKHLQFVSGVNAVTFWFASFLHDVITFVFTIFCMLCALVAFQEDGFKTFTEIGRLLALFLCFVFAVLPLTYLASFWFTSPSSGYTRLTLINIFTGIATFLIVEILSSEGLNLEHVADALDWVFLLVPHYSMSTGIFRMNSVYNTYSLCSNVVGNCTSLGLPENICWQLVCSYQSSCCDINLNYFDWENPGVGRNVVFLICVGVVLFIVLLSTEYGVFDPISYGFRRLTNPSKGNQESEMDDDVDVFQEKQRIRNSSVQELRNSRIAARDLTKYYRKFLAVNRLCLIVDQHECFGLLGVNGAGKTTTFKMLTGDIPMSSGEAWVNGISLTQSMQEIYKNIGYCPQFDALLDDLTGRETLRMFCLLRGYTAKDTELIAVKLAQDFDFYRHLDKKVREYSGGNKRKLSSAIALIGNPLVIYLDEPSTGMDPATKRHLWNALCKIRDSGKCLVLTTHSMEESEALCTRLAIMVNGSFKCIGSVQHLKSKFSEGYTLNVKIRKSSNTMTSNDPDLSRVKTFVETNFPSATLREEYQELLCYHIKDRSVQWSTMFGIMERGKRDLNIEDYSLNQSNLEQVFLYFTKMQRE